MKLLRSRRIASGGLVDESRSYGNAAFGPSVALGDRVRRGLPVSDQRI
jgi:hypothetical protein